MVVISHTGASIQ